MKSRSVLIQVWLLALVVCTAAVALSFLYVDMPVALSFSKSARANSPLLGLVGMLLGSNVILAVEAITVLTLALIRVMSEKRLPPLAEAVGIACLASICAYGIDAYVLKPFFGVPNPGDVLRGARHAFNLWRGSPNSSFPSGHMTLAASLAGVFMRFYRKGTWPLAALLVFGAGLLVAGEWHFVSDVIAGTFVGLFVGQLAAELWVMHSHKRIA